MYVELTLIALSLAIDAFAVSVSKGLSSKENIAKVALSCGIWFGLFQGMMPIIGWVLGQSISNYIEAFSKPLGCLLLLLISFNMFRGARKEDEGQNINPQICENAIMFDLNEKKNTDLSSKYMFPAAIATSIDALVVGFSFSTMQTNINIAALIIGIITFILSFIGAFLGKKIGDRYEKKATYAGSIVLALIAIKILIF